MGAKHPGFAVAAQKISARQGIPIEHAEAILASGARKASAAAKKANPRLLKVSGAGEPKAMSGVRA